MIGFESVSIDQNIYGATNPNLIHGLTWDGLAWAFSSNYNYWQPIAYVSHMVDFQLFGQNLAGHYAVNLLWHMANTAALYLLLREFNPAKPTAESYAKSRLDPAVRRRVRRKLEAALTEQGVYKKSDLSLGTLAELLHERPHYVSQVISQEFSSSFYDLVNRYRIEHAKRLLRESPDCNVLSVALDSGFNSKSAFHVAFRRSTGTTPSNFRQIN